MSHCVCHVCHKSSPTMKWCGKCRSVKYCSQECQKEDWTNHKSICKSFTQNKTTVEYVRSFLTQKMHEFLFALAYYNKIDNKETICNLQRDEKTGKFDATMLSMKIEDRDLLQDKINVIIKYDVGGDENFKTVVAVDKPVALKYYNKYKSYLYKDQSINIVSEPMSPGFPPFEAVTIDDDIIIL